jgi:hypothetical protein
MALGPIQPPIQWVLGALSLGVKWPGMKLTTHLHIVPRSRMCGAIPPFPQYVFLAWCLVKHRDNFTFIYSKAQTSSWMKVLWSLGLLNSYLFADYSISVDGKLCLFSSYQVEY